MVLWWQIILHVAVVLVNASDAKYHTASIYKIYELPLPVIQWDIIPYLEWAKVHNIEAKDIKYVTHNFDVYMVVICI